MDETTFREELQAALVRNMLAGSDLTLAHLYLAGMVPFAACAESLSNALQKVPPLINNDYYAGPVDQSQHSTTNTGIDARASTNTFVEQQHIHQSAPEGVDLNVLLKGYYETLSAQSNKVALPDADNVDATQHEVVLSAIYTTLEVARSVEYVTEHHATASRLVKVFEAINDHQRMVLLGDPGSGKSTCVNFLVYGLTQHELRKLKGDQAAPDPLAYLEREGWSSGSRIPIRIILSQFASWLQENPNQPDGAEPLWNYLGSRYHPRLVAHLITQTARHNTFIVFDGLDEVLASEAGLFVHIKAVLDALSQEPHLRVLVTCRILDYERDQWRLANWPTEQIMPFSPQLQHAFIERWYTVLDSLGRPMLGQASELCDRLKLAVRNRRDLQRLAGNPLLLTMMALLHASKGELPHDRINLYKDCLDLLLRRWRRYQERSALEEVISGAGIRSWQHQDTDKLLNYLGFIAHTQSKASDDDDHSGSSLDRSLLLQQATAFFSRPAYRADYATAAAAAQALLDYIHSYDNGILQFFDQQTLRFPHRTFQEYLAACFLTDDSNHELERDVVARLLHYIDEPAWREVLLLGGSKLIIDGRFREAVGLVEAIAKYKHRDNQAWPAYMLLAGELMLEIGQKTFDNIDQTKLWNYVLEALQECKNPLHKASQSMLEKILRRPQQNLLPAPRRVHSARILSQLRDPSLREISLEPQWCHVPAGTFLCGSDPARDPDAQNNEQPQQELYLPAFAMAAHPVTNTEFGRFIDAKGYQNQDWWTENGWVWLQEQQSKYPKYWDDTRFNEPDQPVVGVSLYEALAYCAWLSTQLSYLITLPTEAQWEKAARGSDGRVYPWGNTFDQDCLNCDRLYEGTTPIGCFPHGRSPYGCYDMAGNVWEWTLSDFNNPDRTNRLPEVDINNKTYVSIRGGAWFDAPRLARSALRDFRDTDDWSVNQGFRLLTFDYGNLRNES